MGRIRILGLLVFLAAAAALPGASPELAPKPHEVLARYLEAGPQAKPWTVETVEVEASIPKLKERGHLRAIRRLLLGRPEFQMIAMEGDRTVRQQVIARYLSAEIEAAGLPPASVAIDSGNYKFRFMGSISDGDALAYIFEITPRKKRAGLIRGQIWIDSATALVRRQTGYLVRSPSIFIRKLGITRDTSIRAGLPYERKTHLEIETRLVGRAELTVTEQPYSGDAGENAGDQAASAAAAARPYLP